MKFADNWTKVFDVITLVSFREAKIIGGIVPNLIAISLFLGAIGYFALTGKMAEMFGWRNKINRYRKYREAGKELLEFIDYALLLSACWG
tara:strand:- start:447 stop:716 length:270 start_codon:yes stop_codon:yes gene_type:complete